jgi:hypothetical protein
MEPISLVRGNYIFLNIWIGNENLTLAQTKIHYRSFNPNSGFLKWNSGRAEFPTNLIPATTSHFCHGCAFVNTHLTNLLDFAEAIAAYLKNAMVTFNSLRLHDSLLHCVDPVGADPICSPALIISDLKVSIDRDNGALRTIHASSNILETEIGCTEKLFDPIDFLG